MTRLACAALALLVASCGPPPPEQRQTVASPDMIPVEAVTLKAADGVQVFGRYYRTKSPKALILLFHQAGSSKGEYASIAPQLNRAGYDALAIDQRSGGDLFGPNETVGKRGRNAEYLEAKQDLQVAVDWGKAKHLPLILWGSSYSSSLAFPVAVENMGAVKAVMAFSPDEYFDDKTLVERAARKLTVMVFVTSSSDPSEVAAAKAIIDAVPGTAKTHYVPVAGVHGSSTLIATKNPKGVDANWQAVLGFLKTVAG